MSQDLGTLIVSQETRVLLGTFRIQTVEAGSTAVVVLRKVNLFGFLSKTVSPVLDYLICF